MLQPAGFEQRRQAHHIAGAHAPGEQLTQQLRAVVAHRHPQQGVHAEHADHVAGVLGEGAAAAHIGAAEHPLGRAEGLLFSLPGFEEALEHLDEVGAVQGLLHGDHPQGDTAQALDVDAAGEQLGEHGDAFLGQGGAWRAQGQAGQARLGAAVEGGGDVDEGFVLQQLGLVQLGEARRGTQADARGAGNGLGGEVRVDHHAHFAGAEEGVHFGAHPGGEVLGRDIRLGGGYLPAVEQGVGGVEEEARRVQGRHLLAFVVVVRTLVEACGIVSEGRCADGPQHAPGAGIAARRGGEEGPGGVAAVALAGECFEGLYFSRVIPGFQLHLGEPWLP
ncbi:hypothetical protein FQZ97_552560 [compost metagenome]